MANAAAAPRPPYNRCGGGRARPASPSPFYFALLTAAGLLLPSLRCPTIVAAAAEVRRGGHVRHKRTVSDFVETLMNAMNFHVHDDPLPLPSTVIARISKLPTTAMVYKYVPVQTLKLSKLRAHRQIAEPPTFRIRYPKKFAIKAEEDASLKNDLPWTLHPLPPPLPTSKTVKLDVDKSMPWALHPLPPPMKTKTHSDRYYYWPGGAKTRKKTSRFVAKRPYNANHLVKNINHKRPRPSEPTDTESSDFKPSSEYDPAVDYTLADDYYHYNHVDHNAPAADHYKHVDYKNEDYSHADNKSPDYKSSDYPAKSEYEDDDRHHEHHDAHHSSYPHDDHTAEIIDSPPPPPPSSSSSEYVSHITIEPSIQIASFSETKLQLGDGTKKEPVSDGGASKQKCQCATNGHRHKRDAAEQEPRTVNGSGVVDTTAVVRVQTKDSNAEQSSRNAYVRPNVGHATDIQILKSHDITDQSSMVMTGGPGYVQRVRGSNANPEQRPLANGGGGGGEKPKAPFRDESDKFKVDFGREINSWDESKPTDGKGRVLASNVDDDGREGGNNRDNGRNNGDDYGYRLTRRPEDRGRGYHIIKSEVENSDRGVAYSVQTPFSVSSFSSSNVRRHPETRERRRHRFRYTDDKTTSSSPFQSGDSAAPLDFEQFGLQSAVQEEDEEDDKPRNSAGLLSSSGDFSRGRGFDDKPADAIIQWPQRFPDNLGGGGGGGGGNEPSEFSGRLTSHFLRDFGDGDGRSFRYNAKPSDRRINKGRLRDDGRPSSDVEESVFEHFRPVVVDFDTRSKDGFDNGRGDRPSRYFGKTDSARGFSKFNRNQNVDRLRLPGRLHESNENAFSKMLFHPSTFDTD